MHRGRVQFSSLSGEPPVINDSGMVDRFREVVAMLAGENRFIQQPASSGSDDFGYFSDLLPSIYFWIGSKEPGNNSGVHTPTFGVSDKIVIPATELAIRYCLELLRQ
jgi:metal-dependent amidase/aminoacylase/carboxypeptidase family protein